jgi:hypothetical protein
MENRLVPVKPKKPWRIEPSKEKSVYGVSGDKEHSNASKIN